MSRNFGTNRGYIILYFKYAPRATYERKVAILLFIIITIAVCVTYLIADTKCVHEFGLPQKTRETETRLLNGIENSVHIDIVMSEIKQDYLQKLFLGDTENVEIPVFKMKDIFKLADTNRDNKMSREEITSWIRIKMKNRLNQFILEDELVFMLVDSNNDSLVTWSEYYNIFLMALGYTAPNMAKAFHHPEEGYLSIYELVQYARYHGDWMDVDSGRLDKALNKSEFLMFRHPERNPAEIRNNSIYILGHRDLNLDGSLSEDEYAIKNQGEDGEEIEVDEMVREEIERKRREYRCCVDVDHNGKVALVELMDFLTPDHPDKPRQEAERLIQLADENQDDYLDLAEIMKYNDIFIKSKIYI